MKQIQLKLHLLIHKIRLQVRFPCSVAAALKVDNQEIPLEADSPLRSGQAILEKGVSHTFTMHCDAQSNYFPELQKVSVLIFLKSSSGRIPAGAAFVDLNRFSSQPNRTEISIQKCPDKNASIEASLHYDTLNEFQISEVEIANTRRMRQPSSSGRKRQRGTSSRAGKLANQIASQYDSRSNRHELKAPDSDFKMRMYQSKGSDRGSMNQTNSPSYQNATIESNNEPPIQSRHASGQRSYIDFQMRARNNELERELKNLQKRQQNQQIELRESNIRRDLLEKNVRQLEGQLRIYKEKAEDSQQQYDNYLKRSQFKDTSYKDQLRTLSDKLAASESEKQKMMYEKNDSISQFQEIEKALRLGLKEKEKQFSEEKTRLNKRIDQLVKECDEAKSIGLDSETLYAELQGTLTSAQQKAKHLEERLEQANINENSLREQLKNEHLKRSQLEEKLQRGVEVEEDKKKLKKRIAEQEQQITKLMKNMALLEAGQQRANTRADETQLAYKDKNSALKALQREYERLSHTCESLRRQLEEKEREAEEISVITNSETVKHNAAIQDMRSREQQLVDELRMTRKQLSEKENMAKNLSMDAEHAQEMVEKANQRIGILDIQMNDLRTHINQLQVEREGLLHTISGLEARVGQLKFTAEVQGEQSQMAIKQLQNQLHEKTVLIQELELNISAAERQATIQIQQRNFEVESLNQKLRQSQYELKCKKEELSRIRETLGNLQEAKSKGQSHTEEILYSLKLKQNEVAFLKESIQRLNADISSSTNEIKTQALEIQRINSENQQLLEQIVGLQAQIQDQKAHGSESSQAYQEWKRKSKEYILTFFSHFKGGGVDCIAYHQDSDIIAAMQTVIQQTNIYASKQQEMITQLDNELAESHNITEHCQAQIKQLEKQLALEKKKNSDLSQNSGQSEKKLKYQIEQLAKKNASLSQDLSKLKESKANQGSQLSEVNKELKKRLDEIASLLKEVDRLKHMIERKDAEEIKVSGKYQNQVTSLKEKLSQVEQFAKNEKDAKLALTRELGALKKEYAEFKHKSEGDAKKGGSEMERLKAQVAKQIKEIETRAAVEQTVRGNLDQARKQITELKSINETIRRRNEKGTVHEKELEETVVLSKRTIASLQKQVKEKVNELTQVRQKAYSLEKAIEKSQGERELLKATVKAKEDGIAKQLQEIKNLQGKIREESQHSKASRKEHSVKEGELKRQNGQLLQNLAIRDKQLSEKVDQLSVTQLELDNLRKSISEDRVSHDKEVLDLESKNIELEGKVVNLVESLSELKRSNSAEDNYLRPLKESLDTVRGHMNEYMRVGDHFQASKNKLLKVANTRCDHPTERFVGERVKEISYVFQRLKSRVLSRRDLSELAKKGLAQEMKTVQVTLDRVLRGEK